MSKTAQKKAEQEANSFLADLLAKHGVVTPESVLTVEHGEPVTSKELDTSPQQVMFHAQGILRSLDYPTEVRLTRICKNDDCLEVFATNYRSVAYCSTLCCAYDLKKYFGISWKPNARIKKESWEITEEPEIIPLRALQAMKMIVDRVERDLGHPIPTEQLASSPRLSAVKTETQSPSVLPSPLVSEVLLPVSDIPKIPAPKVHSFAEEDDLLASLFADDD